MAGSDPDALHRAVDAWREARWFEAHDALEELWRAARPPQRERLHGALQVAIGLHLRDLGRGRAALTLLGRALERLERAEPSGAIDVEALRVFARACVEAWRGGAARELPGPVPPLLRPPAPSPPRPR